jgi:hypothetical protein
LNLGSKKQAPHLQADLGKPVFRVPSLLGFYGLDNTTCLQVPNHVTHVIRTHPQAWHPKGGPPRDI